MLFRFEVKHNTASSLPYEGRAPAASSLVIIGNQTRNWKTPLCIGMNSLLLQQAVFRRQRHKNAGGRSDPSLIPFLQEVLYGPIIARKSTTDRSIPARPQTGTFAGKNTAVKSFASSSCPGARRISFIGRMRSALLLISNCMPIRILPGAIPKAFS